MSGADHRRTEYFPRMSDRLVQRPDGDEVMPPHPALRIQEKGDETLHIRIEQRARYNVLAPVGYRMLRHFTERQAVRSGFSPRHDLPFRSPSVPGAFRSRVLLRVPHPCSYAQDPGRGPEVTRMYFPAGLRNCGWNTRAGRRTMLRERL